MKTIVKLVVLVGAATMACGCGGAGRTRDVEQDQPGGEVFEIRLLGQDAGNLSAALLPVAGVTAAARGQELTVETVAADSMDLTATRQAWLLGRVRVPEGVEDVDFAVQFDDAGGYESRSGNGAVEARGAEVRWQAPVAWLRRNGHVVVQLDLERSLVARGDARRLIPSAIVQY